MRARRSGLPYVQLSKSAVLPDRRRSAARAATRRALSAGGLGAIADLGASDVLAGSGLDSRPALSGGAASALLVDAAVVAKSLELSRAIAPSVRAAVTTDPKAIKSAANDIAASLRAHATPSRRSPRSAAANTRIKTDTAYYVSTAAQVLLAVFPYVATASLTPEAAEMYWVFSANDPDPNVPLIENIKTKIQQGALDSVVGSVANKLPSALSSWVMSRYTEVKKGL